MKTQFLAILFSFLVLGLYSQEFISNYNGDYFGQTPPNDSAIRVIYTTFSDNGNLYYTNVDKVKIHMSENKNGVYDNNIELELGPELNSEFLETCPSLSPDGKYIFFARYNDENEKSDIYWISSEIIETLKAKTDLK